MVPPPNVAAGHGLTTAGLRSRQAQQPVHKRGRFCPCGAVGQLARELGAGGVQDAAELMHSGSVNATEWRNSAGLPRARPSEHRR